METGARAVFFGSVVAVSGCGGGIALPQSGGQAFVLLEKVFFLCGEGTMMNVGEMY